MDTGLGFSVPSSLESIFQKAAKKYGVDVKILETIGYNESRFQATATSSSGAQGIMQLMPSTAKSYGVTNAYDPEQNIMAGAHIISDKLKEFNGNLDLAIGAYACGSGAIHRNGDKLTTAGRYYVAKFRKYYN
ncbi:MAG: transglycosylase SLT domain-containing protein [Lachnospiraceae bacterium]|nr:transglycosylase SLT domain-containing protein [Lachnospiraceae bacterium]MDD7664150.1 transglycosylase SLT domain-containing protein [Lachnospiraceae bacterium]MDY4164504.1 transglycosylase SLT domain-containing protein [Lachnospiraceae bacterium]